MLATIVSLPCSDTLDMRLALRFADKALFVTLPHVREQLIRAEECFTAELPSAW